MIATAVSVNIILAIRQLISHTIVANIAVMAVIIIDIVVVTIAVLVAVIFSR